MPTAPQAKFQFVATGDDVVNAQIQAVVDKLTAMKSKAQDAGQGMSEGMLSSNESLKLVNESLDLKIPRALEKVISGFQSLQGVIAGAGIAGALIAGVEVLVHAGTEVYDLYNKWLNVDEAVDEYNKSLGEAVTKSIQNVNSIEQAGTNMQFFAGALKQASSAQASLNQHNQQTSLLQDPVDYFLSQSYEKDAAKNVGTSKNALFNSQVADLQQQGQLTQSLVADQKQLNDIRLEGLPKILSDEQSDIDLANAKLKSTQDLANLENERRREYNASSHQGGDVPLIPDNTGQTEHDLTVYYAQANAMAQISKNAREAQTTILAFNDAMANSNRQAAAELQVDPYQTRLTEVNNFWNKLIDSTEKGAADNFKVLQKDGVDTSDLLTKENSTIVNLLAARTTALAEDPKMLEQSLNQSQKARSTAIPSIFFSGGPDAADDALKAAQLIKQITAALSDESAAEQVLKDQASTTGETQINLEQDLSSLRTKTAGQLQGQVDALKQYAAIIGDPTIVSNADKLGQKITALTVKTSSWQVELKKGFEDDLQNAFVGIVSGTETVSKAFETMATQIIEQLAKVVFQMYIVKLLQSAIGGLGNMFGGGGGLPPGMTGDPEIDVPGITPHAMGGPVSAGQTYLVGERGPELLNIGASGSITPNNMIGKGGQMPVQVNIHNYGQPMSQSQTSRFDGRQMIVDVVVKDLQTNGPIRQQMKG